jgi:sulfur-oxidizing protein SoxZ
MSSIKIRSKRENGNTQIKILISHPMETGRNKDPKTGQVIPAQYIQKLTVKQNDKVIVSSEMGAGISKAPYFSFILKGGAVGDKISVSWQDNLANTETEEKIIE